MNSRHITEEEVEEALEFCQTEYPSPEHPDRTVVLGQTSSGRRLKIVVASADPVVVVTVADRDAEG